MITSQIKSSQLPYLPVKQNIMTNKDTFRARGQFQSMYMSTDVELAMTEYETHISYKFFPASSGQLVWTNCLAHVALDPS